MDLLLFDLLPVYYAERIEPKESDILLDLRKPDRKHIFLLVLSLYLVLHYKGIVDTALLAQHGKISRSSFLEQCPGESTLLSDVRVRNAH